MILRLLIGHSNKSKRMLNVHWDKCITYHLKENRKNLRAGKVGEGGGTLSLEHVDVFALALLISLQLCLPTSCCFLKTCGQIMVANREGFKGPHLP